MKHRRIYYPEELKQIMVASDHKGSSVKCLSCKSGVAEATIYTWIKKLSQSNITQ